MASRSKKLERVTNANKLIEDNTNNTVIYTDGSSRGDNSFAGYGVYITRPGLTDVTISEFIGEGTNNVAELMAIKSALEWVSLSTSGEVLGAVRILTDSKYAVGVLDKGHTPKLNIDLVTYIRALLVKVREMYRCTLHWVPAHSGIEGNEIADALATDPVVDAIRYETN